MILPILFILQNCTWSKFEPSQLIIESDHIDLEWDPPPPRESEVLPIVSYKIYYRIHGMPYWRLFDIVPASQFPKRTIYHSELGNGTFDFAVSAVLQDDRQSGIHSSLDLDADPTGGWYIIWVKKGNE